VQDHHENKRRGGFLFGWLRGILLGQNHAQSILETEELQSPWRTVMRSFFENKIALAGLCIFLLLLLSCFLLPFWFPLDTSFQDVTQQNIAPGYGMMKVPKALAADPVQIAAGPVYGAGIDSAGTLYLWGRLDGGLSSPPQEMEPIVRLSAGQSHILALGKGGTLYTWGYSRFGLNQIPQTLSGRAIRQLEAGYQISAVLTEDGELTVWGNENLVQLNPAPYQGRIRKFALGSSSAIALLDDGTVAALSERSSFAAIPEALAGKTVVDIAVTDKTAAAVTSDGGIYFWGGSQPEERAVPGEIVGQIVSVFGGRSHFTAQTADGLVHAWGSSQFGQSDLPVKLEGQTVSMLVSDYYQNYALAADGKIYTWGLKGYLMGTDDLGRDIFSRLLTGGRMTLTIGAIAVLISTLLGVLVGGFSGYYGGQIDNLLMRFAEIVGSIPFLPLAIILSAIIGNRISETGRIAMIMVILGVLSWPGLARLVRAQILSEREKEFVTAARAMGLSQTAVIFRHILPNVITVVIVNATLNFASSLLTESSLSFLGFGVVEPNPTWGNMLTGSQSSVVIAQYWWRWVFPALALSLSTISINLVGDGLRDAIDPKSHER
jgi:peptide/nickel transport system permease protein